MTDKRDYNKIYNRAFKALRDMKALALKDQLSEKTLDDIDNALFYLEFSKNEINNEWTIRHEEIGAQ